MRLTTKEITQLELAIYTQAMKIRLAGIEFHIPKMPKTIVGSKQREVYAKGVVRDWVRDLGIIVVGGGVGFR